MPTTITGIISGSGTNTIRLQLAAPVAAGQAGNFIFSGANTIVDVDESNPLAAGQIAVTNQVAQAQWAFNYSRDATASAFQNTGIADNIDLNSSDICFGVWLKRGNFDQVNVAANIFRSDLAAVANDADRIKLQWASATSEWQFQLANAGANNYRWEFGSGETEFTGNDWFFVAGSYDYSTDTMKLWVNGVELTLSGTTETGTFNKDAITQAGFDYLGLSSASGGGYNGDFWMAKQTLNQADVDALYNGGSPIDPRTIVTPEFFMNFGGQQLNDLSENEYTVNNDAGTLVFSNDVP